MQLFLTGFRPYLWLSLLCAILYLPGINSIPAVDRDEARYVQATKQMIETNDYINIKYQETSRNKKPVGIYWLQSFFVKTFGDVSTSSVSPYRAVSVLGAWLAVIFTFFFGQYMHDRRSAFLGAAFLCSSILLTVEAHLAKTDAFLLAMAVLSQGSLGISYMKNKYKDEMGHILLKSNWVISFFFWLGIGASILIKGPVVPIISFLTILTLVIWDKDAKWLWQLKPIFGVLLVFAVIYPWFNAINDATNGEFFKEAIGKDLLPKLLGGVESHGAPFGYYLLIATLTFWPASMFMWPALWGMKRDRAMPSIRFFIAWVLPSWFLFELIPTKLPHYVLPLFPALTLCTGILLSTAWRTTEPLFLLKKARIWYVVWYFLSIVLGAGIFALPIYFGTGYSNIAVLGCGLMFISLALTINYRNKMFYFQSSLASVFGAIAMLSVTFGSILPSLDVLWLSKRVDNVLTKQEKEQIIAAIGYHEPSLVFTLGTDTKLITLEKAVEHFNKYPKSVIIVADKYQEKFLRLMQKHSIKVFSKYSIDGMNYSKGKNITLNLYKID